MYIKYNQKLYLMYILFICPFILSNFYLFLYLICIINKNEALDYKTESLVYVVK